MKVYLVEASAIYETCGIVAVYESKEGAQKYVDRHHKLNERFRRKIEKSEDEFPGGCPPHYYEDLQIIEFKTKP